MIDKNHPLKIILLLWDLCVFTQYDPTVPDTSQQFPLLRQGLLVPQDLAQVMPVSYIHSMCPADWVGELGVYACRVLLEQLWHSRVTPVPVDCSHKFLGQTLWLSCLSISRT